MKLIAVEMSRLTTLFQITKPTGQMFLPQAVAMINGRYAFSVSPDSFQEMSGSKIEFKHGLYDGHAIDELTIYSDGIVISARANTEFLDSYMKDLMDFVENELELEIIRTHSINKIYESNLIVEFSTSPLKALEQLEKVVDLVSKNLKSTSGLELEYEPFGIKFSSDDTKNPQLKPTSFAVERRVGIGYEMNLYFSTAPLKTHDHLEVLQALAD